MGLGRTPFPRLLMLCSLVLFAHSRASAQQAPPPPTQAPPPQAAPPPAIPPAPGPSSDVPAEQPPAISPSDAAAAAPVAPAEEPPPEAAVPEAEIGGEVVIGAEAAPVDVAAEPPAGEAQVDSSGDIVVTGSRIKRSPELSRAAPVAVLDKKQLERTGATNAADVVSQITAAQGSGYQGGGSPLNQGSGAVGTVLVNLRSLG